MNHGKSSIVTVQATFDTCVDAEIGCALLSEGSLQSDEPEAIGLRRWLVQVRDVTPALARRAQAVLRSAHANETRIIDTQRVLNDRRVGCEGGNIAELGLTLAPWH